MKGSVFMKNSPEKLLMSDYGSHCYNPIQLGLTLKASLCKMVKCARVSCSIWKPYSPKLER